MMEADRHLEAAVPITAKLRRFWRLLFHLYATAAPESKRQNLGCIAPRPKEFPAGRVDTAQLLQVATA